MDRVDRARIAAVDSELQKLAAKFGRIIGSTDNGDAGWREEAGKHGD